jgi:hypothetical protein
MRVTHTETALEVIGVEAAIEEREEVLALHALELRDPTRLGGRDGQPSSIPSSFSFR